MSALKNTFSIVVLFSIFIGCSKIEKERIPILKGSIINGPETALLLRLDSISEVVDTLKIGADGSFVCERGHLKSDFYQLLIGREVVNLILYANSTTNISFDYLNLKNTLHFTGCMQSSLLQEVEGISADYAKELMVARDTILGMVGTVTTDSIINQMYSQLDSITLRHRHRLEAIMVDQDSALIMIPALLQSAGNWHLFNLPKEKARFVKSQYLLSQNFSHSYQVVRFSSLVKRVIAKQDGVKSLAKGDKFPDLDLFTPWSEPLPLNTLIGKSVLVVVWSPDLPSCRDRNKEIAKLMWRYRNLGLETYMINMNPNSELWKKAIKEDELNCLHVSDLKGFESPVISTLALSSLPSNFLLNKEGKIVEIDLWGDNLEDAIKQIAKNKTYYRAE